MVLSNRTRRIRIQTRCCERAVCPVLVHCLCAAFAQMLSRAAVSIASPGIFYTGLYYGVCTSECATRAIERHPWKSACGARPRWNAIAQTIGSAYAQEYRPNRQMAIEINTIVDKIRHNCTENYRSNNGGPATRKQTKGRLMWRCPRSLDTHVLSLHVCRNRCKEIRDASRQNSYISVCPKRNAKRARTVVVQEFVNEIHMRQNHASAAVSLEPQGIQCNSACQTHRWTVNKMDLLACFAAMHQQKALTLPAHRIAAAASIARTCYPLLCHR